MDAPQELDLLSSSQECSQSPESQEVEAASGSADPMRNYRQSYVLGEGAFGVVYRGRAIGGPQKGKYVAIKRIPLDSYDEGVPSSAIREISTLLDLKHRNVVQLFDVITCSTELCLILEFMDRDLKKYMQSLPNLDIHKVTGFLYQLLQGVRYFHQKRIIHRDLKPQNLLIDIHSRTIKIADFGLARAYAIVPKPYTQEVVTLWYRAPELLFGVRNYGYGVDIWSLACILAEMVMMRVFIKGESELDQLNRIFRIFGTPTDLTWPGFSTLKDNKPPMPHFPPQILKTFLSHLSDDGIDLLQQMMLYDQSKRLTAKEALKHRFFDGIPEKDLYS